MKDRTFSITGTARVEKDPVARHGGAPYKPECGVLFFPKSKKALSMPSAQYLHAGTGNKEQEEEIARLSKLPFNQYLIQNFARHIGAAFCGKMTNQHIASNEPDYRFADSDFVDIKQGRTFHFDRQGRLGCMMARVANQKSKYDTFLVVMVGTCLDSNNEPIPSCIKYGVAYRRGNVYWFSDSIPKMVAQNPSFGLLENTDNHIMTEYKHIDSTQERSLDSI